MPKLKLLLTKKMGKGQVYVILLVLWVHKLSCKCTYFTIPFQVIKK